MLTTTSTLPAPVQQSLSNKLLAIRRPSLIHNIAANLKVMPDNGGRTLRMRRPNRISTFTVPLSNQGQTPPSQNLTALDIDVTPNMYGTFLFINEQVTLQNEDPTLNMAAMVLGVAMRETEDVLTRDALNSSASSINAVNGFNGDTPTEPTIQDIMEVVRTLANNDAFMIEDMVEASNGFGTAPIREAFWAMGSTRLIGTLDTIQGFVAKSQYGSTEGTLRSEYGNVTNVRFLLSSLGSVSPKASDLGNDIMNIFVCGQESYCCVKQNGMSAKLIYIPAEYNDPLAQNFTIGVKFMQTPRVLEDGWIIRFRCTLTS